MAAEEDKKFNAVLGGFLVNDRRVRAGYLHCSESDTLAAYHERSLLPEEMNSWKEHIVGCARCQAILAELEATDSIPLQVPEKEEVLVAAPVGAEAIAAPASLRREAPTTLLENPASSRFRACAGNGWFPQGPLPQVCLSGSHGARIARRKSQGPQPKSQPPSWNRRPLCRCQSRAMTVNLCPTMKPLAFPKAAA